MPSNLKPLPGQQAPSVIATQPPVYTCQLSQAAYVTFPDGEILQTGGIGSKFTWPVEPWMTDAATASWIELNYLMRPPLTDEEIQLMPVNEIISTYYSLRRVVDICKVQPDPVVSAGLGKYGEQHELNIQMRIFNLRQDLHQISVAGRTYRILVPPALLNPPDCPGSGLGMAGAGVLADVVGYFIPIVGWAYAIASTTYQVVDTVNQLKAAGKAADLVAEIQNGITYAKQFIHDPPPNAQYIEKLKSGYAGWTSRVKQVTPLADQINYQGVHACGPITGIMNSLGGVNGAAAYAAAWKPYQTYFFSQTVYNMCYPAPAASGSLTSQVAPAAVGLGIGALLLLLL